MLKLIEQIRTRLAQGSYVNEAAISHGIVTPILNALGWDSADPDQLVPEFPVANGRVDFALLGLARKPVVFVEVKGVGRALDGDVQLFTYSFHHGVPLCVLTDGREWSFYVPAGQGSYGDRRVYRLQLDERSPEECTQIFERYLGYARVRDGRAFEDAQRDHRDATGRREAAASLPRAWADLVDMSHEQLIDLLNERTEALCGFRPAAGEAAAFLKRLKISGAQPGALPATPTPPSVLPAKPVQPPSPAPQDDRTIQYRLLGQARQATNASTAIADILRTIVARDPDRIGVLADKVRGRSRSLIARSTLEINPGRPDLARAVEIAPGWLVGLNISNREKMAILRAACDIYGLTIPGDLDLSLPNA